MYFNSFKNAQHAFEILFPEIMSNGIKRDGTMLLYNVGFHMENPMENEIKTTWRRWNKEYADFEWQWYLSSNPNATEISKRAKIWESMMDENGNVNSNYGYQWNRNGQLQKVIQKLKENPYTRKASISLYDGKEIDTYSKDTICTYALNFYRDQNDRLSMQVMMRSNDLVFGFCNDQYCFSKLMKTVADELKLETGTYFHFVCNMHIYERHFNMNNR